MSELQKAIDAYGTACIRWGNGGGPAPAQIEAEKFVLKLAADLEQERDKLQSENAALRAEVERVKLALTEVRDMQVDFLFPEDSARAMRKVAEDALPLTRTG